MGIVYGKVIALKEQQQPFKFIDIIVMKGNNDKITE